MKHWLAVLVGLFLIIMGTGAAGTNVAFLFGIGLFGYNVAVLVSLAMRDSIERLADLLEAWSQWEPNSERVRNLTSDAGIQGWYGRPEQYHLHLMQARPSWWWTKAAPLLSPRHTWHYANQTKAQGLLEYALILALVFVVAVVGLAIFGEGLAELFQNTIGALKEAFLG